MRVLVLGGTFEASQLADLLARQSGISSTLSFAGRTKALRPPQIPYRIGGFGGVDVFAVSADASDGLELVRKERKIARPRPLS